MEKKGHAVSPIYLLVDGECVLCHRVTRFVAKRDADRLFRFAALQSPAGQSLLKRGGLPTHDFDTFVMVENGRFYTKSEAALRTLRRLGVGWRYASIFLFVPAFIRDAVYSWIARSRYRWFGKYDTCLLPTADLRERFVQHAEEVE